MQEVKKSFWDFITVAGASVISVPLLILSESIQARYLGPSGYGKVALILSAISLLYLFGSNWLTYSIMRYGKEEFLLHNHLRKTFSNILILFATSFVLTLSLFYTFKEFIFSFLEIENPQFLWIILAGLVFTIVKGVALEVLKVIRLIKLQSVLYRLTGKIFITTGILLLAFVILKIDVLSIIIVYIISDILIILIAFYFIEFKYLFPLLIDPEFMHKIFMYSFPLIFLNWSTYVTSWIDTYVIKYYMTMEDVGKYQAAYKILNLLRSFWGMGIGTITTPIIMVFKTNNELFKISDIYLKRLLPQLLFITMIVLSVIIVTSDYVIIWIYGSEFKESILPFKILIASHNFTTISFGLLAIARSFDMTKVLLYLGLLASIMNVALDIFLIPVFGISGASIASLITFAIIPIILFISISKRFNVKRELPLLFPILILCVLAINILNLDYIVKIVGTGILVVLSYVIAKNHKLILRTDISIFDNIEMPPSIRYLLNKILNILSSK